MVGVVLHIRERGSHIKLASREAGIEAKVSSNGRLIQFAASPYEDLRPEQVYRLQKLDVNKYQIEGTPFYLEKRNDQIYIAENGN